MRRLHVLMVIVALPFGAFAAQTIYFLVGVPPCWGGSKQDSYVLPLSAQQDIDYARYLITAGQSGLMTNGENGVRSIVGAYIVAGKDGINRNYLDPKFPVWSWHVSRFLEFGEIFMEVCDGWPGYTEMLASNAPPGQQMEICYWGYSVVRELGPTPLFLSIIPQGTNLDFYWSAPETNYLYSLEGSQSVDGTNWLAVPGISWPTMTNHWVMSKANAPYQFYRVRAQPLTPLGTNSPVTLRSEGRIYSESADLSNLKQGLGAPIHEFLSHGPELYEVASN